MKMYKGIELWIFVLALTLVVSLLYIYGFSPKKTSEGRVIINSHEFYVDIADNAFTRQRGLAGRESLSDSEGMIFVFDTSMVRRFWMKGMLIPIDIIWIEDGKVVGFSKNAEPQPGVSSIGLKIYSSPSPVSLVLEVRAGMIDELGIKVGDSVSVRL